MWHTPTNDAIFVLCCCCCFCCWEYLLWNIVLSLYACCCCWPDLWVSEGKKYERTTHTGGFSLSFLPSTLVLSSTNLADSRLCVCAGGEMCNQDVPTLFLSSGFVGMTSCFSHFKNSGRNSEPDFGEDYFHGSTNLLFSLHNGHNIFGRRHRV